MTETDEADVDGVVTFVEVVDLRLLKENHEVVRVTVEAEVETVESETVLTELCEACDLAMQESGSCLRSNTCAS